MKGILGGVKEKSMQQAKQFLIQGLLAIALFFVAEEAGTKEKLERMNIGYSAQAGAFAPIWITKEAGLTFALFVVKKTVASNGDLKEPPLENFAQAAKTFLYSNTKLTKKTFAG